MRQPVSVAAKEGQVIDDGDIYEMAGLLDDPGNGFQIIATIFGDENIRGALSTEEDTWRTIRKRCWCVMRSLHHISEEE